jgi:predicted RNA methylase
MNIKTESIENIVDVALEQFEGRLTAYSIATIVNAGLEYLEVDEKVAPQNVYNSTKAIRKSTEDGRFSKEEARTAAIKILKARVGAGKPKATNLLQTLRDVLDVQDDQE